MRHASPRKCMRRRALSLPLTVPLPPFLLPFGSACICGLLIIKVDAGAVINAGVTKLWRMDIMRLRHQHPHSCYCCCYAGATAGQAKRKAERIRKRTTKTCGKSIKYINLPRNVHGKRIKKLCSWPQLPLGWRDKVNGK